LLPANLIAVTITLDTLTLVVAAIIIRRMLLLFIIVHCHGCVIALLTLSCQPPPAFVAPVAGWLLLLSNASNLKGSTRKGGWGGLIGEPVKSALLLDALIASHRPPLQCLAMVGCCVLC
jgi:hypothetical protein